MSRVLLVAGGNPSDWPTIEPATYDYFVGIDRGCLHLLGRFTVTISGGRF